MMNAGQGYVMIMGIGMAVSSSSSDGYGEAGELVWGFKDGLCREAHAVLEYEMHHHIARRERGVMPVFESSFYIISKHSHFLSLHDQASGWMHTKECLKILCEEKHRNRLVFHNRSFPSQRS